jgi:hypothetical protein
MDVELVLPIAAAVTSLSLYVLGLWFGGPRVVSALASASNLMMGVGIVAVGLSCALGVRLSIHLLSSPDSWIRAVGNIIREI